MPNNFFDARLSAIVSQLDADKRFYRAKNMHVLWRPLFGTPFDRLMTDVTLLYLEADGTQRKELLERLAKHRDWTYDATYFMGRVTARIRTAEDAIWVKASLAAARVLDGRADFRDIILSLVLVRHVAEQRGIDVQAIIDAEIESDEDPLRDILLNVRNHSPRDVMSTLQFFRLPPFEDPFFREVWYGRPSFWATTWRRFVGT